MTGIPKRDKRNGFIAVAAGFSLLIMVAYAIKQIFRNIPFRHALRKAPVEYPVSNGNSSKPAGTATSPALEPAIDPGDIAHNTSPIELSDDDTRVSMLSLSDAVLREDWDSQADNEAWRNL